MLPGQNGQKTNERTIIYLKTIGKLVGKHMLRMEPCSFIAFQGRAPTLPLSARTSSVAAHKLHVGIRYTGRLHIHFGMLNALAKLGLELWMEHPALSSLVMSHAAATARYVLVTSHGLLWSRSAGGLHCSGLGNDVLARHCRLLNIDVVARFSNALPIMGTRVRPRQLRRQRQRYLI